jgi:uncharacterized cupin superfamily protein
MSFTVTTGIDVVDAPAITITEYFGHVASQNGTCSVALASVREAAEEAYQAPLFDEYVVCNEGSLDIVHADGEKKHVGTGQAIFLPKNLRVKWIWPEPCKYTVVCLPAFSPDSCGREVEEGSTCAKDSDSMLRLAQLHEKAGTSAATGESASTPSQMEPLVVDPVIVVDTPEITITECFGCVATQDATCSLALSDVKFATEQVFQSPQFDEYVLCNEGSLELQHTDGERLCLRKGQGVFLPKGTRVKWSWPEPCKYTALCIPAFSPALVGREE